MHHHSDRWREALKMMSRCPICTVEYTPDAAKLFAKNETASLVHIACASCGSGFVAMIVILVQGLSSVGMVTDLTFADVERLHKAEPITIDEVIEAYEEIQKIGFTFSVNPRNYLRQSASTA